MAFFHPNTSHVPVEASFHPPEHSDMHIQNKTLYYCYPENKQDKGPNDVIRFHISAPTRLLDTKSIAFFFNYAHGNSAYTTAPTTSRSGLYPDTIIKSLKVSFNNSQTVEFIEEYHRLHNVLKPYTSVPPNTSVPLNSTPAPASHLDYLNGGSLWFYSTNQKCIKFEMSGILGINKYLPMDFIGTLDLEIRLASSLEQSDDNFSISNPYLTMDTYRPSMDYKLAIGSIIQNQGIVLEYPTFTHFSRVLSSSRDEIILNRNIRSAKSIFVFVTRAQDETKLQGVDFGFKDALNDLSGRLNIETLYPYINSYRIGINGSWETHRPIGLATTDVEHVYETLKAFDLHGLDREMLHTPFNGQIIGYNLEKSSLMSGTDIREIKLEFNNEMGFPRAYHVFIYHDSQVLIGSGMQFMTQN